MMPNATLLPTVANPAVLGVLGGGQLGRMFVHAAQALGYRTVVFDPHTDSPAADVAHHHIHADFLDQKAWAQMAELCDAVSIEFENVPVETISYLQDLIPAAPSAATISIAQNRLAEKNLFRACNLACAPYLAIASESELEATPDTLFPAILKTARMGYDGKGQIKVPDKSFLLQAWQDLGRTTCILEQMLPLKSECSVIVARNASGETTHLPVQKNVHHQGILALTEVWPGCVPAHIEEDAIASALRLVEHLSYVGVLCVEFFVIEGDERMMASLGELVVNEIAPRPHNSGHYSVESTSINQFELQVRAMANLPLPTPTQYCPAAMINLLGSLWFKEGVYVEPDWEHILQIKGVHLHLYGKTEARVGRKMGHITITAPTSYEVQAICVQIQQWMGVYA